MVEIKVCTHPDGPDKPPKCKEGTAFIDTGSPVTMLVGPALPKEMLPSKILGEAHGAGFLTDREVRVGRPVKAQFTIPGCVKDLPVAALAMEKGIGRPDTLALIGTDVLKVAGATIHPWGRTARSAMRCAPKKRRIESPRRKGIVCTGPFANAVCDTLRMCPPDAKTTTAPGCRDVRALFDTGAPTTAVREGVLTDGYPAGQPLFAGGRGESVSAHPTTALRLDAHKCPTWVVRPAAVFDDREWPSNDIDVLVGMDYLGHTRAALHPWSTPAVMTCLPKRAVYRAPGPTIEW